jgi:tetratricopeptide (TPR) repeat protein
MKLDEFGFPLPADFDEKASRARRSPTAVTGRRMVLLFGAVLIALAGAALVEFGPEIENKLAQLLNLQDRNPQVLQQALMAAIQERRFAEAGDICGKLMRRHPRKLQLQMFQAQLYMQGGEHAKALTVCDEVLSRRPNDAGPLTMKASILAKMKDYKHAIAVCNRLLKLDPGDPTGLNNRAYFRALARVDLKEALEDVEQALKQEPDNETFLDTRAYLYYLFGRFDEALADYNRILADGGRTVRGLDDAGEIYFHRGLLFKHMGDERRKEEDYDRARQAGFKIEEEPAPLVIKGAKRA